MTGKLGRRSYSKAFRRVAELYAVEKEARGRSPEDRVALRQAKSKLIFDDLEAWLHRQLPELRLERRSAR